MRRIPFLLLVLLSSCKTGFEGPKNTDTITVQLILPLPDVSVKSIACYFYRKSDRKLYYGFFSADGSVAKGYTTLEPGTWSADLEIISKDNVRSHRGVSDEVVIHPGILSAFDEYIPDTLAVSWSPIK